MHAQTVDTRPTFRRGGRGLGTRLTHTESAGKTEAILTAFEPCAKAQESKVACACCAKISFDKKVAWCCTTLNRPRENPASIWKVVNVPIIVPT